MTRYDISVIITYKLDEKALYRTLKGFFQGFQPWDHFMDFLNFINFVLIHFYNNNIL